MSVLAASTSNARILRSGSGLTWRGDRPAVSLPALVERQPYVSRLATRAALYADLQALLASTNEALARPEYRRRVLEDNVLSRRTRAAWEKAWKELAARYGLDGTTPVFRAFLEEYGAATSERDRGLTAYLLFALHDRLVCDLGTDWLYEKLRAAPADLRTADVLAFISSRMSDHPEIKAWSHSSRENLVSHYLSALEGVRPRERCPTQEDRAKVRTVGREWAGKILRAFPRETARRRPCASTHQHFFCFS